MDVHPDSTFRTASGREIQLKVHRCLWSGDYPANSLAAIAECFRARVARAEIDLCMLSDGDFLVVHHADDVGLGAAGFGVFRTLSRQDAANLRLLWRGEPSSHRPALFSEVVETIAAIPAPTLVELDIKDLEPLSLPRVEELVQLVQPIKERAIFSGVDWNLRRLLAVDPTLRVGLVPAAYLDWVPEGTGGIEERYLPRGAYGYLDRHPLAMLRLTSVGEYLSDRLGGILRLVPGASEVHVRLSAFERMLDDGVAHAAELFHREGLLLDVWTLDVGMPNWRERLARLVSAGVDIITTNTPRELVVAGRAL